MKHEIYRFLLFALIVSAFLSVIFLPKDDNLLGFSIIDSFSVAVEVEHITYDIGDLMQLTPVIVNGNDVNLSLDVTYYGTGTMNLSFVKPQNYTCTDGILVLENGSTKAAFDNGTNIVWSANKSQGGATVLIAAPAPYVYQQTESLDNDYTNEIRITSCAHLRNATAAINITPGYNEYRLYLVSDGARQDKTAEYGLVINGSVASFSGFDMSNKTFLIEGIADSTNDEDDNSDFGIGFYGKDEVEVNTTESTEKQFAEFTVRPREIKASSLGIYSSKITVENTGSHEVNLQITAGPAVKIENTLSLASGESRELNFIINHHTPGTYTEEIKLRAEGLTRTVGISLKVQDPPVRPKPSNIGIPPTTQSPSGLRLPLKAILIGFVGLMVLIAIFIHVLTKYNFRHKI